MKSKAESTFTVYVLISDRLIMSDGMRGTLSAIPDDCLVR